MWPGAGDPLWWGAALALAGLTVAVTPLVLSRLPAPVGEPDQRPYDGLATRRFLGIVAVTSLAALLVSFAVVPAPDRLAWAGLGTVGVLLAVVDAHTGYLPRLVSHVLTGIVALAILLLALRNPAGAMVALAAAAGAGALFWALWRWGRGLGFGDVRLAVAVAGTAATRSAGVALLALLLGSLAGLVWALLARWRRGRDGPVPYGPSLVAGPYLALLAEALLAAR
jgi:leader peptidase (prepilin peptidase)/N-methyltransferase